MNKSSRIWQKQSKILPEKDLFNKGFSSLLEAAKYVMCSSEERYAFQRNRELIDIYDRFRCFQFKDKNYVIKIFESDELPIEYYNALRIKQILDKSKIDHIRVVDQIIVQVNNEKIGLLQEDYGYTLYENVNDCYSSYELGEILDVFGTLLELGIEWSGFLPRNLFHKEHKWYCIDFEDVIFHNNEEYAVQDMTIFKLLLGWGQVYDKEQVKDALDKIVTNRRTVFSELDSFEIALGELIDSKSNYYTRNLGFELTFISELPIKSPFMKHNYLNSMDIGHLIEDIFDNSYLSVWYTISTAKIRNEYGDDHYACFLSCFEHLLVVWLNEVTIPIKVKKDIKHLQQISLCLLLYYLSCNKEMSEKRLTSAKQIKEIFDTFKELLPCFAVISRFHELRSSNGWDAAIMRSKFMQVFLNDIFSKITFCFPDLCRYDLLLRGSCGQGLMTMKSDVDFEISNIHKPNGFIAAEKLLSAILSVFDIVCECSADRPTEIDMLSVQGFTRDFHEWCELIVPESVLISKGWNDNLYNGEAIWKYYSEYETQKHNISAKYLFFQIRAIIERYAIKYSISSSQIPDILNALTYYISKEEIDNLTNTLVRCLNCYESDATDFEEMINLKIDIDNMYVRLGVCYQDKII